MTVKRNVYYYNVEALEYPATGGTPLPKTIEPILNVLRTIKALRAVTPNSIRRTGETNLAVRIIAVGTDYITGTLCSMRHDGLGTVLKPDYISGDEIEEDLALDSDADLMEASHFIYFIHTKIIGLEFNAQAPRHKMLEWYLKEIAHNSSIPIDEVTLIPRVTEDVVQQLMSIREVFSLKVKIHRSQAANMRNNTRLTRVLTASATLSDVDYTVNLEIKEDGRSSSSAFPIPKDEIAELWIGYSDIIESLIVNESRGDKLNFNSGQLVGKFTVEKIGRRVSQASILPQIIDYHEVFIRPNL